MHTKRLAILLAIPHLLLATLSFAEDEIHHRENIKSTSEIHLSPQVQLLLVQEMQAIQKGMMDLVPAISSGDWPGIAAIGEQIEQSYILKQKLTKDQAEELHHKLPPAFRELDQSLHHSASMLAHAAKVKNADVVNFYFFKLNQGCVSCHTKFATHRFPGFIKGPQTEEHKH